MNSQGRALVVGAGAVGLSTAIELLESGFDVHVVAEKMSPDTTSDGSGGMNYATGSQVSGIVCVES
jgi:glycine/D-amino acid oxidase-like deaminating enzyme